MSHTTPRHSAEAPQHTQGTSSRQQDTVLSALHQMELTRRDALKALFAAVGAATLFGSPIAALAEPQATQETLNALSDAQAKYDEVKQQLDDIAAQYQELSKKQSETLSQIEDVQDKIDEKQEQIDDTQEEIEAKQEELEEKQEYLAARVASNYKAGGTSALSLLLSSTSFNELISNAYYLDKINESDQRAIEEVHRIQEELAEEKRALEDQKAELEQQKSQLETLKDQQAQQLSDMQDKQIEGCNALYLVANSGANGAITISQAVAVEANSNYAFYVNLSKWVETLKDQAGVQSVTVGIYAVDQETVLARRTIDGNNISLARYMLVSVVANSAENTTLYPFISVEIAGFGTYGAGLYVDDCSFFKTALDLPEGKENLLTNGDIAENSDGWWEVGLAEPVVAARRHRAVRHAQERSDV